MRGTRVTRIDDGGGGTPSNQPQDWTNSLTPLHADISSLKDFYMALASSLGPTAMSSSSSAMAPIPQMIGAGLLGMGGNTDVRAGVFPEGVMIAQLMTDTHAKFGAFLKDVLAGIQCIGNAAGTISEIYGTSDAMNRADLNDVAFAFNDPSANRPKDLPAGATTTSYSDWRSQQASSSGQYAMALTASEDQAVRVITPAAGVTIYMFSDGSSKQIVTTGDYGVPGGTGTMTTTCYYNGNMVGATSQSRTKNSDGTTTEITTQGPSDKPNAPGSSSTRIDTKADGSQTVTSSTVDVQGKEHTNAPVNVAAPAKSPSSGPDTGPIQQAEQQYKTAGDKDYVQQHGSGY